MPTTVLVIDANSVGYGERLRTEFPDIEVIETRQLAAFTGDPATVEVLVSHGLAVNDTLFRDAVRLKWVQSLATGVDMFLRCPSFRRDTVLTSMRGIHGPAMRESAALLMLALARDLPRMTRNQAAHHWDRGRPWPLLSGKTAVVLGTGVSGAAIGRLLRSFDMRVIGVSRTPRHDEGFDVIWPFERLIEAAATADYLIDVLPGGPHNQAVIGRSVFDAMKPTAFFVNIGRGETVDEAALLDCLKTGRIAGAGLDVFRETPLPADSPFWDLPNVLISPHISGYFAGYQNAALPLIIDNMRLFTAGRYDAMRNLVPH